MYVHSSKKKITWLLPHGQRLNAPRIGYEAIFISFGGFSVIRLSFCIQVLLSMTSNPGHYSPLSIFRQNSSGGPAGRIAEPSSWGQNILELRRP